MKGKRIVGILVLLPFLFAACMTHSTGMTTGGLPLSEDPTFLPGIAVVGAAIAIGLGVLAITGRNGREQAQQEQVQRQRQQQEREELYPDRNEIERQYREEIERQQQQAQATSSRQSPRELPLNTVIAGRLAERGGEEWYSIRSPGDAPLIVEVSGFSYLDLEAYDESGNRIDSIVSSNGLGRIPLKMNTGENRTYLLKMAPRGDGNMSYTITAKTPPDVPAQQQGPQAAGQIVQGSNLADKLAWMNAFAQSNTRYVIEVNADERGRLNLSYSGKSGVTVTLRGVGTNRTISAESRSAPHRVGSGTTLILDNNITVGHVDVDSGGTLIMYKGATILAGVDLGNGGTFTMNGGAITGGGNTDIRGSTSDYNGVYVGRGATFTMNGGSISFCDGYGVNIIAGTFTMNGGAVFGNGGNYSTPSYGSGGIRVQGVSIIDATGTVSATGTANVTSLNITSSQGTFTMNGGTVSGNTGIKRSGGGGGVYVTSDDNRNGTGGTFAMTGGTISANTSVNGSGGGVYVEAGTFTKTGGTIYGYSGGDPVNSNAVKDNSGAVQNYRGHAVYVGSGNASKIREGTAGPGVNLSYRNGTATGAWDN